MCHIWCVLKHQPQTCQYLSDSQTLFAWARTSTLGQPLKNKKRINTLLVINESVRVSYMYLMNDVTNSYGN